MALRNLSKEFIQYCEGNELEKVKACLTLGVDVNTVSKDKYGTTTYSGLTIAAKKNYPKLLDLLLSHPDIKINQTTDAGVVLGWSGGQISALMFACDAGNSAIVSRLLEEKELDLNYQDKTGMIMTAAHWASICVLILFIALPNFFIICNHANIVYVFL